MNKRQFEETKWKYGNHSYIEWNKTDGLPGLLMFVYTGSGDAKLMITYYFKAYSKDDIQVSIQDYELTIFEKREHLAIEILDNEPWGDDGLLAFLEESQHLDPQTSIRRAKDFLHEAFSRSMD